MSMLFSLSLCEFHQPKNVVVSRFLVEYVDDINVIDPI